MSAQRTACLDAESLISAVFDASAGLESEELSHVRDCAACTARAAEWEATLELASQDARAAVPPPPDDLAVAILQAVQRTPQDPAPRRAVVAQSAWWERLREWVSAPRVWRPALTAGLVAAIVMGIWIVKSPAPHAPSRVPAPVAQTPAPSSPPAVTPDAPATVAVAPSARAPRVVAPHTQRVASTDSWTSDWAAWDDSTMTQVAALAQSSLRSAVLSSVGTGDQETDVLSSEDPWGDVSSLTEQQRAWLAAELAKKMGGS